LKDENSARGPNLNWLWYDEAGRDDTGDAWKIAVASVRIGENPSAWVTTTPKGMDHWIYKFFVEKDIPEDALKAFEELGSDRPLVEYFFTTIYDNKENLAPEYFAAMLASYPPGFLRQQELMGEFVSEGGVLGDRSWFNDKIVFYPPDVVTSRLRYWDLAATEKALTGKKRNDPDETVGTRLSYVKEQKDFYIEDQKCGFWAWDKIKENIIATAQEDGPYVRIFIEQEPGAGGKNQVAELADFVQKVLPGWPTVEAHLPEGDKVMRANPWFAEASQGHFYCVQGLWVEPFLQQLSTFPLGRHDDKIDSVSGARHAIAPIRTWRNIEFLKL
jgi:predicted phage terminase large subunit-like protein